MSQLLPALARDQSVIVVSFSPDVVAFDIRLVAFGIGTPLANTLGDGLSTELDEVWLDRSQCRRWQVT